MTSSTPVARFDTDSYLAINEARWLLAAKVIQDVRASGVCLDTAFDFGAGPGWFAGRLSAAGLDVLALEGRPEIAAEGQRRAPRATFEVLDFDAAAASPLPAPRDFALAFGILYHMENPLRALRMMAGMTGKVLLLETMILPAEGPSARIIRENDNATQGIQPLALLLSPEAIEQALWASSFDYVYRCHALPEHDDFASNSVRHSRRSVWLASRMALTIDGFSPVILKEPQRGDFWRK